MLLRSRLHEHFNRVVREDLLTLFGCTATLKSLEASIILQGTAQMSDEAKYRAACVLEIMTGQRPALQACRVEEEDPQYQKRTGEEQRTLERIKSAMMHRSNSNATAADFRALGNGTILKTTLRRGDMYDFLEKLREFYLPDILLARTSEDPTLGTCSPTDSAYFSMWNRSKLPQESRFIEPRDTELCLNSAFILKSNDLLKFPDIEVHFEALGPQMFNDTPAAAATAATGLKVILRPTMTVNYPLGRKQHVALGLPKLNHYGVFNYLLAKFFNPYTTHPKLKRL